MSYQCLRILGRLREGPATTLELITGLRICSVTKRISELRRAGYAISTTEQMKGRTRVVWYRLLEN